MCGKQANNIGNFNPFLLNLFAQSEKTTYICSQYRN